MLAQHTTQVLGSRHFPAWLADQRLSLAFTTYQAGKLLLLGLQPDGRLAVFERAFNRCMGLWGDGQTLWMNSLFQLWRLENVLRPGEIHQGHDRLYVPRVQNRATGRSMGEHCEDMAKTWNVSRQEQDEVVLAETQARTDG